jgi:predicted nucleic acid-binding protein
VSGYLLDSDRVIDALNDRGEAARMLAELAPAGVAISLASYGELYQGAYYARDRVAALEQLQTFLRGVSVMPLTEATMERFAVLRGALPRPVRQQVGDMDLLIAATALHHDLTLVTRNRRDFRLVPGLRLYEGA